MLAGIFGVFAAASGRTADVVLVADTAGMQRPEFEQLPLELDDAPLNLGQTHMPIAIVWLSAIVNKKCNSPRKKGGSSSGGSRLHPSLFGLFLLHRRPQAAAITTTHSIQLD